MGDALPVGSRLNKPMPTGSFITQPRRGGRNWRYTYSGYEAMLQDRPHDRNRDDDLAQSRASDAACELHGRFMLWVDGVGGYLVCLQDAVCLGLATPGNAVAIPIMGDLSRRHARLRREDGYVIEPLQAVRVNGRPIRSTTALSDGDEIELGEGVRLRFRQPHALSATARLEFLSRHRTEPSAVGILLMAESCVLGPKWQDHVVCRQWAHDVVLFRRDERLFCRTLEPLEVNGRRCEGQAPIAPGSHVEGSDFSFCLQQVV